MNNTDNLKLNVAYSSDNKYVKQLGISILSLLENNKKMKEINIYVIDNNIKQCNKNIIEDLVNKYDRRVIFLPFEKICDKLKTDNTFSVSSFARIFLSKIEEIS